MPPSPAQTASPLSLLLFSFLDATVWKAYGVPHLPLAQLPPLADSDHSKHLARVAFPHLDPYHGLGSPASNDGAAQPPKRLLRRRSIVWAVILVFRKEVVIILLLLFLNTVATLLSPYGLKKLLEYMDNRGDGQTVKPWVWIASVRPLMLSNTILMSYTLLALPRSVFSNVNHATISGANDAS